MVNSDEIVARECDVFKGENLNYFFVGRPAYKHRTPAGQAKPWQLPVCLIFEFDAISSVKRVFPFDTGAFSRPLFPPYISMMDRDSFDVSAIPDSVSKIVGAYFGSTTRYFNLEPRGRGEFTDNFDASLLQAEALAVHYLASEESSSDFDDRRLTIELQQEGNLNLSSSRPIAVIAPSPYFDDSEILDVVQNKWGARVIPYNVRPLGTQSYYSTIYDLVFAFYKSIGLL